MAQLTWRNIDAPNFNASLNGIELFSQLLNQGLGSARAGINQFDQVKSDRMNRAVQMSLAGAQNSEELQNLLGPGGLSTVLDPRRASSETIGMIASRPGQLLNQDLTQENLTQTRYDNTRTRDENTAMDNARTGIAAIAEAAMTGDPAKIAAARAAHPALAQLPANKILGMYASVQNLEQGAVGMTSTRQGISQSATRFDWDKGDRALQEQAANIVGELKQKYVDIADAERDLNSRGLSGRLYTAVASQMGFQGPQDFSSAVAGAGGGFSAGGGSADGSRVMNYQAASVGFGSVPDSVRTLGQAVQYGQQSNAAQRARYGDGASSAMGVYQITEQTMRDFGPKVLGKDWQNAEFNIQNQDKIAGAIFAQARGSNDAIRGRWAALKKLSDADVTAIRNMPWEQARDRIAALESNSNPTALLAQSQVLAERGVVDASMQNNAANPVTEQFSRLALDNRPIITVATELATELGNGATPASMTTLIRRFQDQARRAGPDGKPGRAVTPALVAEMIKQSAVPVETRSIWDGPAAFGAALARGFSGDATSDNLDIDNGRIGELLKSYTSGDMDLQALANVEIGQAATGVQQAQATLQQAQATLLAKQNAAARSGRPVDTSRERQAVAQAQAALMNAQGVARNIAPGPVDQPQQTVRAATPPPRRRPPVDYNRPSNVTGQRPRDAGWFARGERPPQRNGNPWANVNVAESLMRR